MSILTDILRSKDDEFDSDLRLTVEVMDLEQNYSTFYEKTVGELERQYRLHKKLLFIIRYGELKSMIKSCYEWWHPVGDTKLVMYSESVRNDGLLLESGDYQCPLGLYERATEELKPLSKHGLRDDIRKKEIRKQEIRSQFLLLFASINSLRQSYADSRHMYSFRRYREIKVMAKTLIRNERLMPKTAQSSS